jgi:predicted nucleotide-binding protein
VQSARVSGRTSLMVSSRTTRCVVHVGGSGYYGANLRDTCKVCQGLGILQRTKANIGTPVASGVGPTPRTASITNSSPEKVFIVHGRNHLVRDAIDLYLTKELRLETIVMEAGPHEGRALPEKFEEMAAQCEFAIFILTADDQLIESPSNKRLKRTRQNAVLEIGYFWGAFGRRRRVAFLVDSDPEMDLPSDIQGLGWIAITPDLADTKLRLRRELVAAGVIK